MSTLPGNFPDIPSRAVFVNAPNGILEGRGLVRTATSYDAAMLPRHLRDSTHMPGTGGV